MPQANNPYVVLYWLVGIMAILLLISLIIGIIQLFLGFSQELRYLNNEIGRTHGLERERYIKRKRKLWLSLLPFVKY